MDSPKIITDIRDLAREATVPSTGENIHFVVAPSGSTLLSLKEYQYPFGVPPERITAAPKFQDAPSFCSYVNTFKDADLTRILADATPSALSFLAVIDYHAASSERKPEFLSHRASLTLKLSEEWKLWYGLHDKLVPQADFAEFLEENRADIVKPDPATMLEIAKDLIAKSDVNFESKINSRNGSATLRFSEQIKATVANGSVEIPESFTIRIPVFFGEAPIDINAILRFRIADQKLKFQYKLYRPAEVIAKAFDVCRKQIADATTMEVLLGTL